MDPDFIKRQRRDAAAIPLRVWLAVLDQGLGDVADVQRTLPRLKAPTLLIWGSADPIMEPPVRDTTEYIATLKSRRSIVLQPLVDGQLTRIFVKSPEFVMPAHQGGREAGAEPGTNTLQHRTEDATQT